PETLGDIYDILGLRHEAQNVLFSGREPVELFGAFGKVLGPLFAAAKQTGELRRRKKDLAGSGSTNRIDQNADARSLCDITADSRLDRGRQVVVTHSSRKHHDGSFGSHHENMLGGFSARHPWKAL